MTSPRTIRRLAWGAACLGVLLVLIGALILHWPGSRAIIDERQERRDLAAPLPRPGATLEQTFTAQHDQLTAVEVVIARWSDAGSQVEDGHTFLHLSLLDSDGRLLREAQWASNSLAHEQALHWRFEVLPDSAGEPFTLRVEGSEGNRAGVWAYSLDGYPRGELRVNGTGRDGDLAFKTFYASPSWDSLATLGSLIGDNWGLFGLMVLVLVGPGLLILPALPGRVDPAAKLSIAVAGSLALTPLSWLWLSTVGGRWKATFLWLALIVVTGIGLWRLARRRPRLRFSVEGLLLAAILLAGLGVRLLAIRDLALPAWVDSPQHWLISQLMAESGRVPVDYRPWMPVDRFWYHFGFHSLAASLHMLAGIPIERIMLVGGQFLNALVPLSVYGATVLMGGRRRAGLLAAFTVALLTVFPAFYTSWGRYTQLSGMLILGPLMGVAYRLFQIWGRRWRVVGGGLVWVALALGGLFVVHARVWVYGVVWVALLSAGLVRRVRRRPDALRFLTRTLVPLAAGSLLAAGPWFVRVGRSVLLPQLIRRANTASSGSYNAIPWGYVNFGWEPVWFGLAGAAALVSVALLWRRGKASDRLPLVLFGWVAAMLAVVNVGRLGVPLGGLVNNNTLVISLFLPVAVLIGWLVDQVVEWSARHVAGRTTTAAVLGGLIAVGGLYGANQQINVLNDDTILVWPDDLALLERVEQTLPADALVAVNGWLWLQPGNWAGRDGGYWLLPLTGRDSTMPPIGYGLDPEYRDWVNGVNAEMAELDDWSSSEAADFLQQQGITHVFIGGRGGILKPEQLAANPRFRCLDSSGAAWLFEVLEPRVHPGTD